MKKKYPTVRRVPRGEPYAGYWTASHDGRVLGVFSSAETAKQAIRRIIRKLEGGEDQRKVGGR